MTHYTPSAASSWGRAFRALFDWRTPRHSEPCSDHAPPPPRLPVDLPDDVA